MYLVRPQRSFCISGTHLPTQAYFMLRVSEMVNHTVVACEVRADAKDTCDCKTRESVCDVSTMSELKLKKELSFACIIHNTT
jgi:hypothetical protein